MSKEKTIYIENILFSSDKKTINKFKEHFQKEINDFIGKGMLVYEAWKEFDSIKNYNIDKLQKAYISGFLFNGLNNLVISTKLLVRGLLIPSGNLCRNVIESVSVAILCTDKTIPVFNEILEKTFRASSAPSKLQKYQSQLGINPFAVSQILNRWKFYHDYSHATEFNLATIIYSATEGKDIIFGTIFDEGKVEIYGKELKGRSDLAQMEFDAIQGIKDTLAKM